MATPKLLGEPQWLPLDVPEMTARLHEWSVAERSTIFTAYLLAWGAPRLGRPACSIPADPDTLTRLLGVPFAMVAVMLSQHFQPHPEHPAFLVAPALLAQYDTVQTQRRLKIESAAKASFFAKKAKAAKGKPRKDFVRDGDRTVSDCSPKSNQKNTTSSSVNGLGAVPLGADAPLDAPGEQAGTTPRIPGPSLLGALNASPELREVMPRRLRNSDQQGATR